MTLGGWWWRSARCRRRIVDMENLLTAACAATRPPGRPSNPLQVVFDTSDASAPAGDSLHRDHRLVVFAPIIQPCSGGWKDGSFAPMGLALSVLDRWPPPWWRSRSLCALARFFSGQGPASSGEHLDCGPGCGAAHRTLLEIRIGFTKRVLSRCPRWPSWWPSPS